MVHLYLVIVVLGGVQGCGAGAAADNAGEGNRAEALQARSLRVCLRMDVRRQRERLLLIYLIRVHRSFEPWRTLRVLRHL